jgi:hypothetical protein
VADLLLWTGDEAVLADRRRRLAGRNNAVAWVAPSGPGTAYAWRVPGTRGLAPTREDAQAAAEATLRAAFKAEPAEDDAPRRVLEALVQHHEGLPLSRVSLAAGVSVSVASRVLVHAVRDGWAHEVPGRYPRTFRPGAGVRP